MFRFTEIQELQPKECFGTAEVTRAWGLCAPVQQQALQVQ